MTAQNEDGRRPSDDPPSVQATEVPKPWTTDISEFRVSARRRIATEVLEVDLEEDGSLDVSYEIGTGYERQDATFTIPSTVMRRLLDARRTNSAQAETDPVASFDAWAAGRKLPDVDTLRGCKHQLRLHALDDAWYECDSCGASFDDELGLEPRSTSATALSCGHGAEHAETETSCRVCQHTVELRASDATNVERLTKALVACRGELECAYVSGRLRQEEDVRALDAITEANAVLGPRAFEEREERSDYAPVHALVDAALDVTNIHLNDAGPEAFASMSTLKAALVAWGREEERRTSPKRTAPDYDPVLHELRCRDALRALVRKIEVHSTSQCDGNELADCLVEIYEAAREAEAVLDSETTQKKRSPDTKEGA